MFQNAEFKEKFFNISLKKMLTESCVMFFSPSRAVLSAILRDEYLTSAVRTKEVLTAEVKYSSRKIGPKTARDGEKT